MVSTKFSWLSCVITKRNENNYIICRNTVGLTVREYAYVTVDELERNPTNITTNGAFGIYPQKL